MSVAVPPDFERSAAPSQQPPRGGIVPNGIVVVVYFSKLGGRLRAHQKIMPAAGSTAHSIRIAQRRHRDPAGAAALDELLHGA